MEITLADGSTCLFDQSDAGVVVPWKWKRHPQGYASRTVYVDGKYATVLMHRAILGAGTGQHVHHRNGNKLDNQRGNLELMEAPDHLRQHDPRGGRGVLMMSDAKPLHVLVAEALGWEITGVYQRLFPSCRGEYGLDWYGIAPGFMSANKIPRYDLDWTATGPLIQQFKLSVGYIRDEPRVFQDVRNGYACTDKSLLVAICRAVIWIRQNRDVMEF